MLGELTARKVLVLKQLFYDLTKITFVIFWYSMYSNMLLLERTINCWIILQNCPGQYHCVFVDLSSIQVSS